MNSILAVAFLIAALSLCNLTDNSKSNRNSNSSNTNSTETQNAANPNRSNSDSATDPEALKIELMKIEYEVTTASFNGDISTLASYVADDYSGAGVDGKIQNKNQLLASTKPDKMTKS